MALSFIAIILSIVSILTSAKWLSIIAVVATILAVPESMRESNFDFISSMGGFSAFFILIAVVLSVISIILWCTDFSLTDFLRNINKV